MFLELLPEIQEKVISYCCVSDLKNLARTCSECNESLKEVLFHAVRVPISALQQNNFAINERLENMKYTKALRISVGRISEHVLKDVCKLENLNELSIDTNDETLGKVLEGLICLDLKVLNVRFSSVTDLGMVYIQKLSLLEELDLTGCSITDAGLSHIATLPALKKLDLSSCYNISDGGFSHVCLLSALEELVLRNCGQLKDEGFSHITSITTLKKLNASYCYGITDDGFSHVESLSNLQDLVLCRCKQITDVGFTRIAALTTLKKLDVSQCGITDTSLSYIIDNLTVLKELRIRDCDYLTNECISYYERLARFAVITQQ